MLEQEDRVVGARDHLRVDPPLQLPGGEVVDGVLAEPGDAEVQRHGVERTRACGEPRQGVGRLGQGWVMTSRTRIALAVSTALVALAAGLLWSIDGPGDHAVAAAGPAAAAPAQVPEGLRILCWWDRQRAAAYASGDVAELRALYAPGSRTGRRDVAVLRAYADRGLVVRGLLMQVLSCDISASGAGRIRLVVTDRVKGAVVVRLAARDPTAIRLPADQPSRREVTFVRRAGGWLVAEVRTAAPRR